MNDGASATTQQDSTSSKKAKSKKRPVGRPKAPVPRENLLDILKEIIEDESQNENKVTLYRGHSSFRYKLRPALFRDKNSKILTRERSILRELITRHPNEFSSDESVFDYLVRMQHYGLPTRLLDVTYNPLVAIFFACEKDTKDHSEVISITVSKDQLKYYDSDTVHCIANLSNLTDSEKADIQNCSNDKELKEHKSGERLFDFIAQKRPNFSPRIVRDHLFRAYVVSPKLNNPRILAQNGAFLIFGIEKELSSKMSEFSIKKFRIDKGSTSDIRKDLNKLGVNKSMIYPSLDQTANKILEDYISGE